MGIFIRPTQLLATALLLTAAIAAQAFESGSTGADGPFNPTVDTVLPLPDDGIFNFTSVNIPAGVTVRFERNALNTPVRMLVAEDALIDGIIDVRGGASADIGSAGDGIVADDGLPGLGGAGGFDGGRGGEAGGSGFEGGQGVGPGGGFPSEFQNDSHNETGIVGCAGGGGGFGTSGVLGRGSHCNSTSLQSAGGPSYGNDRLLPLIGGSGGGGGAGGETFAGSGGGGGGGALLVAVSGTLTVNGSIRADGGDSGDFGGAGHGGGGGGGAGGGIRLIATTIAGDGPITAGGGEGWSSSTTISIRGTGGAGRVRFEAETMNRSAGTTPQFSFAEPGPVFLAGMPSLRIASVGGTDAPAVPTGSADIVLPQDFPNPVDVVVEAFNVPLGNTVTVTLTPATGDAFSVVTNALDGTEAESSAMAQIDIPGGPSTLLASVSFTVSEDQSTAFNHITDGEPVHEVRLMASAGGASRTVLITEGGREVVVPGEMFR